MEIRLTIGETNSSNLVTTGLNATEIATLKKIMQKIIILIKELYFFQTKYQKNLFIGFLSDTFLTLEKLTFQQKQTTGSNYF